MLAYNRHRIALYQRAQQRARQAARKGQGGTRSAAWWHTRMRSGTADAAAHARARMSGSWLAACGSNLLPRFPTASGTVNHDGGDSGSEASEVASSAAPQPERCGVAKRVLVHVTRSVHQAVKLQAQRAGTPLARDASGSFAPAPANKQGDGAPGVTGASADVDDSGSVGGSDSDGNSYYSLRSQSPCDVSSDDDSPAAARTVPVGADPHRWVGILAKPARGDASSDDEDSASEQGASDGDWTQEPDATERPHLSATMRKWGVIVGSTMKIGTLYEHEACVLAIRLPTVPAMPRSWPLMYIANNVAVEDQLALGYARSRLVLTLLNRARC